MRTRRSRPLTKAERALVRLVHEKHGIHPSTTRARIQLGWPEGRLHEEPVTDRKRCARTRRKTPACTPKPGHQWRRWRGPPEQARKTPPKE